MSDFQDFLRIKTAYVAKGEFKPGKFNEAKQLYAEAVSTYGAGFQGAYLLQEPGTDRGIAIILWESVSDMAENQDDAHEAVLQKMNPLFAGKPETAFYDVVCDIQPNETHAATEVR
ncbi:MAG: antibiotic biosynthesis monooxygenase family protein [Thainema sp.]